MGGECLTKISTTTAADMQGRLKFFSLADIFLLFLHFHFHFPLQRGEDAFTHIFMRGEDALSL